MAKSYSNKSSVLKRRSRYIQGGDTVVNKKKLGWWERFTDIPRDDVTDVEIYIEPKYAGRADIIAYSVYGDPTLEWIVLQYNNIVDTVEELVVGKTITVPSRDRVFFEILTNSTKVQVSNQ